MSVTARAMGSLAVISLLAGCEQDLLAGIRDAACASGSDPPAAATYLLYLNTEGVTLTAGNASDARTNVSDNVSADAPHIVPPFLDGIAGRRAFIDQIVMDVQTTLAPYSIDLVTVRPTANDFYMFVMGGDPLTVLGKRVTNAPASRTSVAKC